MDVATSIYVKLLGFVTSCFSVNFVIGISFEVSPDKYYAVKLAFSVKCVVCCTIMLHYITTSHLRKACIFPYYSASFTIGELCAYVYCNSLPFAFINLQPRIMFREK